MERVGVGVREQEEEQEEEEEEEERPAHRCRWAAALPPLLVPQPPAGSSGEWGGRPP